MQRYYHLHDDPVENASDDKSKKRSKCVAKDDSDSIQTIEEEGTEAEEDIGGDHTHSTDEGGDSDDGSEASTDIEDVMALPEPEVGGA